MTCVAVAAIPMALAIDAGRARAQAIPESVWRIPARAASPAAEPRYLDEMRTVVDAIAGDSSNGHRDGVRAYGWVYGHGLTTDDAVRIEVSAGGRPVAEARCRVESPPDASSLLAMGTFLGGYFSCSTERTIEALGDLSVAFTYLDDANDRRIPLRTFAVRSAAAYAWSGSDTHIGVPYIYAASTRPTGSRARRSGSAAGPSARARSCSRSGPRRVARSRAPTVTTSSCAAVATARA
jgi:hypothetical protein